MQRNIATLCTQVTIPLYLLYSTEQLQGPEYSYVVVAKTLQSSLKEIDVDR
jgi:hypothetical protein